MSAQASPKKTLSARRASVLVFNFINLFAVLASQRASSKSSLHRVNSSVTNSLFPDFSKIPILPLHTLFTASKYSPCLSGLPNKYLTVHSTATAQYAAFNESLISTPSLRSISSISSSVWSVVSETDASAISDRIVRRRTVFLKRESAPETGKTWRSFLMTWSCAVLRIRNSEIHRQMSGSTVNMI
ncbi:hypothetical protein ACJW30_08G071200 [Castanea mollissima]